jgi:hypothetical protein
VPNKDDIVKRTMLAPGNAGRLRAGDLLSVELGTDEHIQWIWCHHGERGSSVIGYTITPGEVVNVPEKQPIGFFPLEEKEG